MTKVGNQALNPHTTLAEGLAAQWARQGGTWSMFSEGLTALRSARSKTFQIGGARVVVQCNAARVTNVSAKVDPKSIAERACFLCTSNRPAEQEGYTYRDEWLILCNPSPLFEPHYTIITKAHVPQRVLPAIDLLIEVTRDLAGKYTVFYNGPGSGASAPDHLHLQAGPTAAMPFEADLLDTIDDDPDATWLDWIVDGVVRIAVTRPDRWAAVVLTSPDGKAMADTLRRVIATLGVVRPAEPEPMLNLFGTFRDNRWIVWLFPRGNHRPRVFGDNHDHLLISPGAVDMNGLLISPRPHDYERLTPELIGSIYDDVTLSPEHREALRAELIVH